MDATRRERIILYGVVPIAATIVGALATVVATRLFGTSDAGAAIKAIAMDKTITVMDKAKLIDIVNGNDKQFYDFMKSLLSTGAMLIALLVGSGFFSKR